MVSEEKKKELEKARQDVFRKARGERDDGTSASSGPTESSSKQRAAITPASPHAPKSFTVRLGESLGLGSQIAGGVTSTTRSTVVKLSENLGVGAINKQRQDLQRAKAKAQADLQQQIAQEQQRILQQNAQLRSSLSQSLASARQRQERAQAQARQKFSRGRQNAARSANQSIRQIQNQIANFKPITPQEALTQARAKFSGQLNEIQSSSREFDRLLTQAQFNAQEREQRRRDRIITGSRNVPSVITGAEIAKRLQERQGNQDTPGPEIQGPIRSPDEDRFQVLDGDGNVLSPQQRTQLFDRKPPVTSRDIFGANPITEFIDERFELDKQPDKRSNQPVAIPGIDPDVFSLPSNRQAASFAAPFANLAAQAFDTAKATARELEGKEGFITPQEARARGIDPGLLLTVPAEQTPQQPTFVGELLGGQKIDDSQKIASLAGEVASLGGLTKAVSSSANFVIGKLAGTPATVSDPFRLKVTRSSESIDPTVSSIAPKGGGTPGIPRLGDRPPRSLNEAFPKKLDNFKVIETTTSKISPVKPGDVIESGFFVVGNLGKTAKAPAVPSGNLDFSSVKPPADIVKQTKTSFDSTNVRLGETKLVELDKRGKPKTKGDEILLKFEEFANPRSVSGPGLRRDRSGFGGPKTAGNLIEEFGDIFPGGLVPSNRLDTGGVINTRNSFVITPKVKGKKLTPEQRLKLGDLINKAVNIEVLKGLESRGIARGSVQPSVPKSELENLRVGDGIKLKDIADIKSAGSRSFFQAGDVLFTRVGSEGSVGRTRLFRDDTFFTKQQDRIDLGSTTPFDPFKTSVQLKETFDRTLATTKAQTGRIKIAKGDKVDKPRPVSLDELAGTKKGADFVTIEDVLRGSGDPVKRAQADKIRKRQTQPGLKLAESDITKEEKILDFSSGKPSVRTRSETRINLGAGVPVIDFNPSNLRQSQKQLPTKDTAKGQKEIETFEKLLPDSDIKVIDLNFQSLPKTQNPNTALDDIVDESFLAPKVKAARTKARNAAILRQAQTRFDPIQIGVRAPNVELIPSLATAPAIAQDQRATNKPSSKQDNFVRVTFVPFVGQRQARPVATQTIPLQTFPVNPIVTPTVTFPASIPPLAPFFPGGGAGGDVRGGRRGKKKFAVSNINPFKAGVISQQGVVDLQVSINPGIFGRIDKQISKASKKSKKTEDDIFGQFGGKIEI